MWGEGRINWVHSKADKQPQEVLIIIDQDRGLRDHAWPLQYFNQPHREDRGGLAIQHSEDAKLGISVRWEGSQHAAVAVLRLKNHLD